MFTPDIRVWSPQHEHWSLHCRHCITALGYRGCMSDTAVRTPVTAVLHLVTAAALKTPQDSIWSLHRRCGVSSAAVVMTFVLWCLQCLCGDRCPYCVVHSTTAVTSICVAVTKKCSTVVTEVRAAVLLQ